MRILVIGASGYVGQALIKQLDKNHEVYGTYFSHKISSLQVTNCFEFDVTKYSQLTGILEQIDPDIVISCLRGDFDLQLKAHRLLADFYQKREKGYIIYLSTANVFDADMSRSHVETDHPVSNTDYGRYKIDCETMLAKTLGDRAVIIRIPGVWGKDCPRIKMLIQNAGEQKPIETHAKLYVNITLDVQIAEWIDYIIRNDLKGVFHIGTKDVINYVNFQEQVARALKLPTPVFDIEEQKDQWNFAVLPGRADIPEAMQLYIADVIKYLEKIQVE